MGLSPSASEKIFNHDDTTARRKRGDSPPSRRDTERKRGASTDFAENADLKRNDGGNWKRASNVGRAKARA
jgi:hypothetical protein